MNMEEWNIEKIKEYISQFKTRKQFEDDQEYDSIRDFFKGNRDLKTWKELPRWKRFLIVM